MSTRGWRQSDVMLLVLFRWFWPLSAAANQASDSLDEMEVAERDLLLRLRAAIEERHPGATDGIHGISWCAVCRNEPGEPCRCPR